MPADTRPPGERTGSAHPKCYARELLDCCETISREHYFTENLLRRLGRYSLVSGASWVPRGEEHRKDIPTFGDYILCVRHNNALKPLDTAIGRFWDTMVEIQEGRSTVARVHDGHDLERWALKAFIGQMMAGTVREREGMQTRYEGTPPIELIRILFGEQEFPQWHGYFFTGERVNNFGPRGFNMALRASENPDGSIGATYAIDISMAGLPWITTFLTPLTDDAPAAYRPRGFVVRDRGVIELRWREPFHDYIWCTGVAHNEGTT